MSSDCAMCSFHTYNETQFHTKMSHIPHTFEPPSSIATNGKRYTAKCIFTFEILSRTSISELPSHNRSCSCNPYPTSNQIPSYAAMVPARQSHPVNDVSDDFPVLISLPATPRRRRLQCRRATFPPYVLCMCGESLQEETPQK